MSTRGNELECDAGVIGAKGVHHLLAIDGVRALGHEVDGVTVFGEKPNAGLKIPEETETGDGKKDVHRGRKTPGAKVQATALSPTEEVCKSVKTRTPRGLP
jgi:hypothetical protein